MLKEVKRLEKKYNFYSDDSELTKINNRTTGKISLDNETKTILHKTLRYSEKVNLTSNRNVLIVKKDVRKGFKDIIFSKF